MISFQGGDSLSKFVYFFGKDVTDGKGSMKDLLGGKGAGLAEMQISESLYHQVLQ
jgi:pyruvate,orthophosphate dikinase